VSDFGKRPDKKSRTTLTVKADSKGTKSHEEKGKDEGGRSGSPPTRSKSARGERTTSGKTVAKSPRVRGDDKGGEKKGGEEKGKEKGEVKDKVKDAPSSVRSPKKKNGDEEKGGEKKEKGGEEKGKEKGGAKKGGEKQESTTKTKTKSNGQ
jgi:hypothetical protein